jgi:hypothetical protein
MDGQKICQVGEKGDGVQTYLGMSFEAVLGHLAAQRVPVDTQHIGGLGQVSIRVGENPGNETPLELATGLCKADPLDNHLLNEPVELFVHAAFRYSSSKPLNN